VLIKTSLLHLKTGIDLVSSKVKTELKSHLKPLTFLSHPLLKFRRLSKDLKPGVYILPED